MDSPAPGQPPSVGRLAWVYARYANFTLGGGSATTAVLHGQLVARRRWLDEERFALCFALGRLTPGTNVLAFCTATGWLVRGVAGAAVALLAASIPCSVLVVVFTALFERWQGSPTAQAAIHGAVAAAVAITAKTGWTIAKPYWRSRSRIRVAIVAPAAFLLYVVADVPAVEVLLLAAAAGALWPAECQA